MREVIRTVVYIIIAVFLLFFDMMLWFSKPHGFWGIGGGIALGLLGLLSAYLGGRNFRKTMS